VKAIYLLDVFAFFMFVLPYGEIKLYI